MDELARRINFLEQLKTRHPLFRVNNDLEILLKVDI